MTNNDRLLHALSPFTYSEFPRHSNYKELNSKENHKNIHCPFSFFTPAS